MKIQHFLLQNPIYDKLQEKKGDTMAFFKYFFSFLCLVATGFSQEKSDFYELMGKNLKVWALVQEKDYPLLETFNNQETQARLKTPIASIPKKLHFIWVGPRDFPKKSLPNVLSWIEKHKDFEVNFWSDRARPLPHPAMLFRSVQDFNWQFLKKEFLESSNYGEQSDLLRYEILYQQGGVYIDHDVVCFKPLDDLLSSCDLFCGLEPPHKPVGEVSITVCNNLIASCSSHPILRKTIEEVLKRWRVYRECYPGIDADSITKRVYHTTFSAFDQAVKELMAASPYKTRVLPAGYFNKIEDKFGRYAHHLYAGSWFEKESSFEKNMRKRLVKICRKNNQILLLIGVFCSMIFFFMVFTLLQLRKLKKQMQHLQHKR